MIQRQCKACLIRDGEGGDLGRQIEEYRQQLPEADRVSEVQYELRLKACLGCKDLDMGVCMQCGCFVELRAAQVQMHCPAVMPSW